MKVDLERLKVINNADARRFEAQVGDQLAVIDYIPADEEITFTHTGVPAAFEGQGIAGRMTRAALEYARANGMRVIPLCAYIAAYICRHPEYQSLLQDLGQHERPSQELKT